MRNRNLFQVPNLLSLFRLVGSPILAAIAIAEQTNAFVALMIVLLLSDWLDGKIAVLWRIQTSFGARLDSIADYLLYAAIVFGGMWLKWNVLIAEWPWLVAAIALFALSSAVGLIKFKKLPAYHTHSAKTCGFLTSVAAIALFTDLSIWPLRIAAVGVMLTNIESLAITWALPEWRADVGSFFRVLKARETVGESG